MPAPGLRITIRRAVTGLSANFKLIGNGGFRPVAAVSVPYPRKKRLVRERTAEVFKVALSMESVRTLMHSLGFRKLSPRPIHPKADLQKQEDFRKNFKTLVASALPEGIGKRSVERRRSELSDYRRRPGRCRERLSERAPRGLRNRAGVPKKP